MTKFFAPGEASVVVVTVAISAAVVIVLGSRQPELAQNFLTFAGTVTGGLVGRMVARRRKGE